MSENKRKEQLKQLIISLCSVSSVSGFEKRASEKVKELCSEGFDEFYSDSVGNCTLVKRCGRENAPRVLVDAHLDEVGMIVSCICDGGFLRVTNMGGIDVSILQAADVMIYGNEILRGVIGSTPPHLKKSDDLPKPNELLVDVGLPKEKLEELVPLGTPVGFAPVYTELLGEKLCGKAFDDKACGACAVFAVANTPRENLAADVYVTLSAMEETSRLGGVSASTFAIDPDYAMTIDVGFARTPGTKDLETSKMGEGISITASASTHRVLTQLCDKLCDKHEIPYTVLASPMGTGTNATSVNLVGLGIPVVDVGLPLASMHTYVEVISLTDALTLCDLVSKFICDKDIAAKMTQREEIEL